MIAALLFALAAIPVVERPATTPKPGDTFAVMITGDGGWRKIDERVAARLRAEGIPVVGFLASDYFRVERTPDESANALEQVIRGYQSKWQRSNVILIGYSRGADALPFMASRLPPDLLARTKLIALLGLESWIDFKFSPWWTPSHYFERPKRFDVAPEVEKLRGMKVLCVYGEKETDSLCPTLDPKVFTIVRKPGGHHFAGKYDDVGNVIFSESRRSN